MKKKKFIIIFFVILIPLYFIIFRNNENKISNNFIIDDFSEVDSLIIKKDEKIISLKKKENTENWYINNKYEVNKKAIKKLKQALTETKINKPVSKKNIDSVKNTIHSKGKEISIFNKKEELINSFYISDYDNINKVTYAISDKDKTPYIISIPGLEDNLNQRYNSYSLYWINPEIFTYKPHEIKEIQIIYSDKNKTSYKIEIEKNIPKIFLINENKYMQNVNISKIGSYLSYFMNVKFSDFNTLSNEKIDSLKNCTANFTIIVNDTYNVSKKVELYKIKISDNPIKYDFNKLYAIINKEDIVFVKYFDIDLILKDIKYFK